MSGINQIQRPKRATSRRNRPVRAFVRILAFVAALFQAALFAEHNGAAAVAATGMAPPGARLGFLEICTGAGVTRLPASVAGGAGPERVVFDSCPICSSPAACGFDLPDLVVAPVWQGLDLPPEPVLPAAQQLVAARLPGDGPIRAPPLG